MAVYPHLHTVATRKTVTFTGAANLGAQGAVPLFDITGQVQVISIVGFCTTELTSTTGTLALGVTGSTTLFIGATTATTIDANEFWVSTKPTATAIALPTAVQNFLINADIIGTVATADVTAGVMEFCVYWRPISDDGALVAA